MNKFNNIIYAFLLTSITLVGCEDWLDVNRSKDDISSVSAELILPVLTFYAAQTNYDHAEFFIARFALLVSFFDALTSYHTLP